MIHFQAGTGTVYCLSLFTCDALMMYDVRSMYKYKYDFFYLCFTCTVQQYGNYFNMLLFYCVPVQQTRDTLIRNIMMI